ncbi:MAG: glycosyltransferase [Acidaminococcaceae bacterium]
MIKDRIIYFGGFEFPDRNAAAQRSISLSKSFRDLGYNVILVGLDKQIFKKEKITNYNSNIIDIEMMALPYPRSLAQWYTYLFSCKREAGLIQKTSNVSAVICYNYPAVKLYKLNKFCMYNDIPLIADVTEWYPPSDKTFPLNLAKDFDTNLRMKLIQPRLNNIICISDFLYHYYKSKVANCVFIPGTVDKKDKKWCDLPKYASNIIFTLGYAGNPGPKCEKERIDLLILAVCQLNAEGLACHLKIAGVDKSKFELAYPKLKENEYYKECIHYLGVLPHEECIRLIRTVDYFVIVRRDNIATKAGFPTKLSESFACGTPVIATPSGNISDFVIDGENGFVTKDFSYKSLINTIKKAIIITNNKTKNMHKVLSENNVLEYTKYTDTLSNFIQEAKRCKVRIKNI